MPCAAAGGTVTGPSGGSRWNGLFAVWSREALDMAAEGQRPNDDSKMVLYLEYAMTSDLHLANISGF